MQIEHLPWTEVEKLFQQYPAMVLPLGASLKEHGPHLPLNNDLLLAEALAKGVALERKVLLLPALGWSYYPSFLEYAGSVSLTPEVATGVVVDIATSLHGQGAPPLYVLNTGISTARILIEAQKRLQEKGIEMAFTQVAAFFEDMESRSRELWKQARGTHADEGETSLMLYLYPDRVRMELARKDDAPSRGGGILSRDPQCTTGVYSASGSWGDPTLATSEKGEHVYREWVKWIIRDLDLLTRGRSFG